jgi:DNA-binding transcriptional ArsR family regulator
MSKKPVNDAHFTAGGRAFSDLNVETFRLNGRLLLAGDRLTKGLGLTSARWQVMGALRSSGEITVSHIARNMGLQRQSVQRTVDLLEQEGLVKLVAKRRPGHPQGGAAAGEMGQRDRRWDRRGRDRRRRRHHAQAARPAGRRAKLTGPCQTRDYYEPWPRFPNPASTAQLRST